MNRLVTMGLWILMLSAISLPANAEPFVESEIVMIRGQEVAFIHGPIPIDLASPTENDISMDEALHIAQQIVINGGVILEEELAQCLRNIHYVILSDLSNNYRIGGWVVTYFLSDSYADVQIVIMEAASGNILLTVRGARSGNAWNDKDRKHVIAFGAQNFLWPVEWNAVYDSVFGLPGGTYWRHVLPTENDISQAKALEIAKTVLRKEFDTDEQEIEQYLVDYMFLSGWQYNEEERTDDTVWNVGFYSTHLDEWGNLSFIGSVILSSTKGEIYGIVYP